MLWLLVHNKLRMMVNDHLKSGIFYGNKRKRIALIGAGLAFYIFFNWAHELFRMILLSHEQGSVIVVHFLIVFLFAFFIFLFFSGVTISIHYLFVSDDMPLLFAAPLTRNTIIGYKLIESVVANSSFFLFIGLPIFVAFGFASAKLNLIYFPGMLLTLFVFITLPISISFLVSLLIVRILPATRAKELMAVFLGLFSLGMWFIIQMLRASEFDKFSPEYNPEKIDQIAQFANQSIISHLPSSWTAKTLFALSRNDIPLLITNAFPLICVTALLVLLSLALAHKAFSDGIIGPYTESAGKMRKTVKHSRKSLITLRSVSDVVLSRDFKLLYRDFRHLTNILLLVAMMIIFPFVSPGDSDFGSEDAQFKFIPIILFSAIISSQFSSRLIPIEGKAFWITMLLPQSWCKILRGKFALGLMFNLIAVWLAITISGIYFSFPLRVSFMAMVISFFITFSASVFGLTIGSLFPNFKWDHPKRMLSSTGTIILTVGSLVFAGLWVGLISIIYSVGDRLFTTVVWIDVAITAVCFIITTGVTVTGMVIISKKMKNLEWNF